MSDKKLKLNPKKTRTEEEFAEEPLAEYDHGENPWEAPDVTDKKSLITLYLSQRDQVKLKYIAQETGRSQQQVMRELLCPGLDVEIEKIQEKKDLEEEVRKLRERRKKGKEKKEE